MASANITIAHHFFIVARNGSGYSSIHVCNQLETMKFMGEYGSVKSLLMVQFAPGCSAQNFQIESTLR